jgi:flagella basal body P-ring formation protein FlgA
LIPVRIVSGEKTLSTVYATAMIQKFNRVFRAKRLIQRHEQIDTDDLELMLCEVTRLASVPYRVKADLVGKRTTRVISRGRVLTEDMVEHLPLIQRGDRIQILVRHGNLTVSTSGFAQEDGWMGDQIRVKNTDGRREIIGRVQGESLVEVGT